MELARQREIALHNEASALRHARDQGQTQERQKWQGVLAYKDAEIAGKDVEIAGKNAEIAGKDAEIERLRTQLRAKL